MIGRESPAVLWENAAGLENGRIPGCGRDGDRVRVDVPSGTRLSFQGAKVRIDR